MSDHVFLSSTDVFLQHFIKILLFYWSSIIRTTEGHEKVARNVVKVTTFNPKISLVNKDPVPAKSHSPCTLHGKNKIKSSKTIIPLSNDRIQHPHSKTSWQSVNQILLKGFTLLSSACIDNLMSLSHTHTKALDL